MALVLCCINLFTMAIPSLYDGENALDTRELNWISVQMGSSKFYGETMISWDGIGLLVVVFMAGMLLGYLCAVRVVGARAKAMMMKNIKQYRAVGDTATVRVKQITWNAITVYL